MALKRFCQSIVAAAALVAGPTLARDEVIPPAVPSVQDAPIALLADLNSGQVLHTREADRRFLPASVTKVMTAYLAFELIDEGRLKVDRPVVMDAATFKQWGHKGSSLNMKEGERTTVDEVLLAIMTVSANDGSILLAKSVAGSVDKWVAMMNAKARELGMADSHFGTPNGWMDDGRTYVSARDLVKLAHAMISRHPELFRRYVGHKRLKYDDMVQVNHDPLLGRIAGADGIKTGYTRQAGYNYLGTATRDGRRLVLVVAGIDRPAVRASLSRAYMEWGFSHFASRSLFDARAVVGEARVQQGDARVLPLVAPHAIFVSFPRGTNPPISLAIRYNGPLSAPIRKGTQIATLEISIKGQQPFQAPLVAGADLAQANWWQRLRNGLFGFFG